MRPMQLLHYAAAVAVAVAVADDAAEGVDVDDSCPGSSSVLRGGWELMIVWN